MDIKDLKNIIHEVMDERASYAARTSRSRKPSVKKTVQTSKALIFFASVMYALTWLVAVYSWFQNGVLPKELMQYATGLYGASLAIYGGKSAYENKAKIMCSHDQAMRFDDHGYP